MRRIKKMAVAIASVSVLCSVFVGIGVNREKAQATVNSELPKVPGLYLSEYFDRDERGVARTDTDAAGNTVLVNGGGEWIRYQDQDNPEYLLTGLSEGWGFGFDNKDEKWFDYVADGKVTHVDPSELTITHLDGTPCSDITITASKEDPRVAVFDVHALEKVKISYKGAETNNAMIGEFALRTGFYTGETMSLDSQIIGETTVVNGKEKDVYFHLTDSWENVGFRLDLKKGVTVRCWNEEKKDDVDLSAEEAKEYVTVTPVSENDPHHLIYKVTAKGKQTKVADDYQVKINFTKYDMQNESDQWEEDRAVRFRVTDTNALYAADFTRLTVKGDRFVYPEDVGYESGMWYGSSSASRSFYLLLKYSDENGSLSVLTDPSKLTFYRQEWDEAAQKDIFTKVDESVLKAEKAYADSDLVKVTYLGEPVEFGNEYVITYDGAEPKGDEEAKRITIAFNSAYLDEVATYRLPEISDENAENAFQTDGTGDLDVYAVTVDFADKTPWNQIQSVVLDRVTLTDEKGNDLSAKVQVDKNAALNVASGRRVIMGTKVTVPKGTLSSSAKMILEFTLGAIGGDGKEHFFQAGRDVFFFYSEPVIAPMPTPGIDAPVKGTKATIADAVYTVTGTGEASLTTGKKNAKTITVPESIKISGVSFKVTAVSAKACKGNAKLTKLTIGKNVQTIGKNAFSGCKKLKTITIKGTALKTVGAKAFTGVPEKAKASVPKSKKAAYQKLLKKGGFAGKVK